MLEGGTNHYYGNNRIKGISLLRVLKPPVSDEDLS